MNGGEPREEMARQRELTSASSTCSLPALEVKWLFLGRRSRTKYYYDAFNRRIQKVYPTAVQDEFFYDLGHQMLEDQGNTELTGGEFPLDENIWLGGRLVAVVRSGFDSSWARQSDFAGQVYACGRNDEDGSCDVYAIVSDHIGKPVLSLDSSRRITGVGEHEPFGALNRVEHWIGTSHPYTTGAEGPIWNDLATQPSLGMNTAYRFHLTMVDTEENCSGTGIEGPSFWDGTTGGYFEVLAGYHRGESYTHWWTPQVDSSTGKSIFRVGWGTYAGNCRPRLGTCGSGGTFCADSSWQFKGYATRDYEFQRYQAGAQRFFPLLRFPGQYFDEETHLHENWNRFYDPTLGRYLQPEPLLAPVVLPSVEDPKRGLLNDPQFIANATRPQVPMHGTFTFGGAQFVIGLPLRGLQLSAYSYAFNSPLYFIDPTGWNGEEGGPGGNGGGGGGSGGQGGGGDGSGGSGGGTCDPGMMLPFPPTPVKCLIYANAAFGICMIFGGDVVRCSKVWYAAYVTCMGSDPIPNGR